MGVQQADEQKTKEHRAERHEGHCTQKRPLEGDPAGRHKPVIGLCGGIASGKSLVADMLEAMGAFVIDSDALAHEALADPPVIETFCSWWGEEILVSADCSPGDAPHGERRIDRSKMADVIFSSTVEKNRMEAFLYPRLEARRIELTARCQADPGIRAVVLNSPLLYEVGLEKECDTVWFIDCDRGVRVQRVKDHRGWTEAELDRREKLQKPLDEKKKAADDILDNNSGIDVLRSQVKAAFQRLLKQ